jgi:hypothetical protein
MDGILEGYSYEDVEYDRYLGINMRDTEMINALSISQSKLQNHLIWNDPIYF